MKLTLGHGANRHKVIVSLCDYSGNWPKPYADAGYTVAQFDLKHGDDCTDPRAIVLALRLALQKEFWTRGEGWEVRGVLAAPPCTDFTVSGAQYWPKKDADGTTARSLAVVDGCLTIINSLAPSWWALENPVGRLPKLRPGSLGKPRYYFDPFQYALRSDFVKAPAHSNQPGHYADQYTKKTGIWGTATRPSTDKERNGCSLPPIRACAQGSWIQKLGGKSERTKELRSMTPMGFARAFYATNP